MYSQSPKRGMSADNRTVRASEVGSGPCKRPYARSVRGQGRREEAQRRAEGVGDGHATDGGGEQEGHGERSMDAAPGVIDRFAGGTGPMGCSRNLYGQAPQMDRNKNLKT